MPYVGLHTQQVRNNSRSVLLLCMFPCLVVLLTFLLCVLLVVFTVAEGNSMSIWEQSLMMLRNLAPFVLVGVAIWFLIAYFANTAIIRSATGARPLQRKENKRVYNLVENLCMTQGMTMPKINVIEDDSLNAYASGINNKTYTVALSRGIINHLDDEELEGVIAHELTHIRNRDVRLLVISIVFVGIFAMIAQLGFRSMILGNRRSNDNKGAALLYVIVILIAVIGYFLSILMRFAISRKREYLADADAAGMTKKPWALASALRKISGNPNLQKPAPDDVAQLFIEHSPHKTAFASLFATHPPIKKRIEMLEQF